MAQFSAVCCSLAQFAPVWHRLAQSGTVWCSLVQFLAICSHPCLRLICGNPAGVQSGAVWRSLEAVSLASLQFGIALNCKLQFSSAINCGKLPATATRSLAKCKLLSFRSSKASGSRLARGQCRSKVSFRLFYTASTRATAGLPSPRAPTMLVLTGSPHQSLIDTRGLR